MAWSRLISGHLDYPYTKLCGWYLGDDGCWDGILLRAIMTSRGGGCNALELPTVLVRVHDIGAWASQAGKVAMWRKM